MKQKEEGRGLEIKAENAERLPLEELLALVTEANRKAVPRPL